MGKTKLINVRKEEQRKIFKAACFDFVVSMFVFAIVLLLASNIFRGFYVDGLGYAFIAAILISFLDSTLRPTLTYLTLPVTVLSLGLLYPLANVIILKLAGLLLGSHMNVEGIIAPFFIAVFMTLLVVIPSAVLHIVTLIRERKKLIKNNI